MCKVLLINRDEALLVAGRDTATKSSREKRVLKLNKYCSTFVLFDKKFSILN
jgi:hypothetical protein